MKLNLDINEIKHYLKYDNSSIDEATLNNIDKATKICIEHATPRYLINEYKIERNQDHTQVVGELLAFESSDLSKHLDKCDSIIIIVATLGLELDYLIKKLEITDIGLAYVLNCVSVEYLEKYLDYVQDNFLETTKYKTSRYSIGYGDLDLFYQSDLIKCVNVTKRIGVNVLESHLMVPSKSVSAIIGLSDVPVSGHLAKCPNCLDNGKCSGQCIRKVE